MGQKAKSGGTITRAKLGYKNVRITHEGREIRTVEIDPEYAAWVTMAFELYATGEYSFHDLRDALTDAGLRMPATRRYGRRPISIHKIGAMLRDRYYLGYVEYDGIEYPRPTPATRRPRTLRPSTAHPLRRTRRRNASTPPRALSQRNRLVRPLQTSAHSAAQHQQNRTPILLLHLPGPPRSHL
jgi:hypothetical protein